LTSLIALGTTAILVYVVEMASGSSRLGGKNLRHMVVYGKNWINAIKVKE
jgi:hypothetical protein